MRCQKKVIHYGARTECTCSSSPDGSVDFTAAYQSTPDAGANWLSDANQKRGRRLLMKGAGGVLALIGASAQLLSFKMADHLNTLSIRVGSTTA